MTTPPSTTSFLPRPDGRVAFDVAGEGPLVVLVPGMGDLRSTYRHVVDALRAHGHRVAVTDLRGHGDSDASFDAYGDEPTAGDLIALIEHLDDGPAVLVGNSMGAGAAVVAAAERPDLVQGLALLGPFVRDGSVGPVKRALFRLAMARPWVRLVWRAYLPSLYAGQHPEDLDQHLRAIDESLRRHRHAAAFSRTSRTSHDAPEARLAVVRAPAIVLMGEQDPDFPEPRAEAEWIGEQLDAEVVMVPEAGHYPQSQRPDVVLAALTRFLSEVALGA
jgi:pimeloyl-ACP methyl ester carboxylesterase